MDGLEILKASLSVARPTGASGALWQYHSRSDRHSKVACWCVLFDLLAASALLRHHALTQKIVFGVNHEMRDFKQNRKKDLDLVVARPADPPSPTSATLASLVDRYGVVLTPGQRTKLVDLPVIHEGPANAVLIALEAKAAMTEHSKARPRLYDELNSSHLTVHGASSHALAVGLVMVNASTSFVSPSFGGAKTNVHKQPTAAVRVIEKVEEIPRRTQPSEEGFDGLAVVLVDMANDGSPVEIVTGPPAPSPNDIFSYTSTITRIAAEYDSRFIGL